jgi:acyl-CoA thioester hydrolase
MARIKIDLPEHMWPAATIPVRITDLNYGGHVGNDRVLAIMQEARVQLLRRLGYGELDVEGLGLIMTDSAVEYKAELFYGDEVEVLMAVTDMSRLGFDFVYELQVKRQGTAVVAARAKTGMLCFDYTLKKPASLPETARQKLLAL